MGQYDPLQKYLSRQSTAEVPMTFAEIEKVVGRDLPASAFKHRAWWSNNPSSSVITHAWLEAGYQTERVNMETRRLVFRRKPARVGLAPGKRGEGGVKRDGQALFDELYGCMEGSVTVAPGVDLTDPTGEIWDAER